MLRDTWHFRECRRATHTRAYMRTDTTAHPGVLDRVVGWRIVRLLKPDVAVNCMLVGWLTVCRLRLSPLSLTHIHTGTWTWAWWAWWALWVGERRCGRASVIVRRCAGGVLVGVWREGGYWSMYVYTTLRMDM